MRPAAPLPCPWAQRVEVAEIARIIGTKDLEENSNLWAELKAFSSILSELASADLGPSSSVVGDELVRPCRKVGDATVHDGQIMHGVSCVSKGIRDTLVVIFK